MNEKIDEIVRILSKKYPAKDKWKSTNLSLVKIKS